jgi:hypothetical protein
VLLFALVAVLVVGGVGTYLFIADPWCNLRARPCPDRPTTAPFTVTHERPPKAVEDRLRRDDSFPAARHFRVRGGRFVDVAFRAPGLCGEAEGPSRVRLSYGDDDHPDDISITLLFRGARTTCDDLVNGIATVDLPEQARRKNVAAGPAFEEE